MSKIDRDFFISVERLEMYDEFSTFSHIDRESIIAFVQLAYCKESPLVELYESLNERLQAALKESGLPEDRAWSLHLVSAGIDVVTEKLIDPELTCLLDKIDDMISCYVSRIQNSSLFDEYITLQMLKAEFQYRLRKPVAGDLGEDAMLKAMDTKVKIKQPYLDLQKDINERRVQMFQGNERIAKKVDERLKPKSNANAWAKKGSGK
jgi:hypothetical protein